MMDKKINIVLKNPFLKNPFFEKSIFEIIKIHLKTSRVLN